MTTKAAQAETLFPEDKPKPKAKVAEPTRGTQPLKEGPRKGGRNTNLPPAKRPPSPGAMVVHKPQPPLTLLQVCADAARDKNVDVAKMRELLELAREEEARAADRELSVALTKAQAAMPTIMRDTKGDKHKYAKLETVSKAIDPILRECGFSLSYGMADSPLDHHYRITATLSHNAGASRRYFIDLPADTTGAKGAANKTGTQGVGSTISYGRRYLKLMIFDVTLVGEDDDGAGGPAKQITAEQAEALNDRIDEVGVDKRKFCAFFNIDGVAMLPENRLKEANARLDQYAANNRGSA